MRDTIRPAGSTGASGTSVARRHRVDPATAEFVRAAVAAVGRADLVGPGAGTVGPEGFDAVVGHALAHRVAGCVHESVSGWATDELLEPLGRERSAALIHHLMTVRALRGIGDVLGNASIPWVVVKGPVLASHIYGDPGLRSSGDIDVLVPRARFGPAVRALEASGWSLLYRNWPFLRQAEAGELPFGAGHLILDLHWHLAFGAYDRRHLTIEPEALLERARPIDVGGLVVPTFDPVDTLLHLGFHAAHSGADRLVWMKDIERCLAREELDAVELAHRARQSGCAFGLGLALRRAEATMHAAVPDGLVDELLPRDLRALDRLANRFHPVASAGEGGSPTRFVASCLLGSRRTSVQRLGGVVVDAVRRRRLPDRDLDEHDPRRSDSPTFPAGTEADKERFLAWVSGT